MYNIFNNIYVQEWTEKAVRKYLQNPKKFAFTHCTKNKEVIYGFDGFVKELDRIIRCEEWSRIEYEIGCGYAFENDYSKLEKWDCYQQCKPNMEMIAREVIFQYKQYKKNEGE